MTLIEFIKTALLGMAGWAFFVVAASIVESSIKKYTLNGLKDATSELKRLNDYLLKKVAEIDNKEYEKLEKVEKRDIIK